ncbi:MAG TPA: PRC-barrel domain-containing protein [Thermomicrobiales bacterium]|nr:PRC-barrel domain-containing protein [Thermomicrobiales bacterium]
MPGTNATLHKLSDSEMTVADPAEDVRGRDVKDRAGEDVGHVEDLLIDDDAKVRYLRVASGGFLGIGEHTFLIPVDAITRIDNDHVHVDQTREHLSGTPAYDPDLTYDEGYYTNLYGYYGYAPYWSPGYRYPGYPFYV